MKMNKSFSSWLSTMAIVAGLAGTSFAQNKFVDASEFGRTLGRAKKDHHIEVNLMAGFANKFVGYSIAYGYIVNDGLGEVNIPFTYTDWDATNPGKVNSVYGEASNRLIGTGLKYRKFRDEIDEGLFYGGGLRLWLIQSNYVRKINGSDVPFTFDYQNWAPIAEIGYTHKFSTDWGANVSSEVGGSFSTFDDLSNQNSESSATNPGDPGQVPAYDHTGLYFSVNAGIFYAF